MKFLLFSDVHANKSSAEGIVAQSRDVDVVIGAGDFGNVRRKLGECIDVLSAIDRPAVLVAGNNESTDELREACQDWGNAHVLHGDSVQIGDVTFFGIGGGIPKTPFGPWSYDFSEEEAERLLAPCPEGCVLISHSPPKGVLDRSSRGLSLGSTAVREAIVRRKPLLVVCGHIHESGGKADMLGETSVVNAGPGGMSWTLQEKGTGRPV